MEKLQDKIVRARKFTLDQKIGFDVDDELKQGVM